MDYENEIMKILITKISEKADGIGSRTYEATVKSIENIVDTLLEQVSDEDVHKGLIYRSSDEVYAISENDYSY